VAGLHKSLSIIDRRDYVVPRRREKKPTARIWPRYSSMPKTCVTTKLRDVANKGKDANEHMKQRTGGEKGKAGLRRAENAWCDRRGLVRFPAESCPPQGIWPKHMAANLCP